MTWESDEMMRSLAMAIGCPSLEGWSLADSNS
jgi:hypothetical protein